MTILFRRALLVGALLVLGILSLPASAETVYPITFPVDGPNTYSADFGACRDGCSRLHEGVDIMADKGLPVVAAADGLVVEVRGIDAATGIAVPGGGQWLIVDHDGWQTWYLHLNNDTPGTNDGLGIGISQDIIDAYVAASATGADIAFPVVAGQQIGLVGNSGADWGLAHLHFELHVGPSKWDSPAIDPYPSLVAADSSKGKSWNGAFADDDGSVHEGDIETLAAAGITKGCNPPANTNYCPDRLMTRGEIAAFIARTLSLPAGTEDAFVDDTDSIFEADIDAVAAAGIGFGCTETDYCPDQPLLRGEMAEMLVRSFATADPARYSNPDGTDFFTDDEESEWQESINLLMAAGVTKGCNPPANDQFCPDRPLIRAELASFFVRALGA